MRLWHRFGDVTNTSRIEDPQVPAVRIDNGDRVYRWHAGSSSTAGMIRVHATQAKPVAQTWLYSQVYE